VSRQSQVANPFYPLVALAGIVFCVTALAYVAALVRAESPSTDGRRSPSLERLAERGDRLLLWEAGGLAVASVLAMGLDRWRTVRDARAAAREPESHREP
jgi:hypothetical protein